MRIPAHWCPCANSGRVFRAASHQHAGHRTTAHRRLPAAIDNEMAGYRGGISNPQGSQGQGPSELMLGPDWSEAPRATARRQEMAEREGFEPSERLRAQRFSRPPRSTTPAPLRYMRCRGLKVRRYIAKCGEPHKRRLATFPRRCTAPGRQGAPGAGAHGRSRGCARVTKAPARAAKRTKPPLQALTLHRRSV